MSRMDEVMGDGVCLCLNICSISISYGRLARMIFHEKHRPSDVLVIANSSRKLLFYFCSRGGILIKFVMEMNNHPFHIFRLFFFFS